MCDKDLRVGCKEEFQLVYPRPPLVDVCFHNLTVQDGGGQERQACASCSNRYFAQEFWGGIMICPRRWGSIWDRVDRIIAALERIAAALEKKEGWVKEIRDIQGETKCSERKPEN
jgi:hypothetical protein